MVTKALRDEMAKELGLMFRSLPNSGATNGQHDRLCTILSIAADMATDTPQEREDFLALVDETEIAGE